MHHYEFRGKRLEGVSGVNGSSWVYGDFVRLPEDDGSWQDPPSGLTSFIADSWTLTRELVRVDPSTVGLFTGLEDANGKKIFQGDIVVSRIKGFRGSLFFVEWRTGAFKLDLYTVTEPYTAPCFIGYLGDLNEDFLNELEVIGNIYEDPNFIC